MPCYEPLTAYKSRELNPGTGKRSIVFNKSLGFADLPLQLPCGQCIGCKLERSRIWAIRCSHETSLYNRNCFVTLTYNDENLSTTRSLDHSHFQKFMKRLRKQLPQQIRFFMCGEYGEQCNICSRSLLDCLCTRPYPGLGRPHYHSIFFNTDLTEFGDRRFYKQTPTGGHLFTSSKLDKIWGKGFCNIGAATFESAAYIARYCTKKITGQLAHNHYSQFDPSTGEIWTVQPEYSRMSTNGGIGKGWYQKYGEQTHSDDSVVIRGIEMLPPPFYDKKLEATDPKRLAKIKGVRIRTAKKQADNNTKDRLKVRHTVAKAKANLLTRNHEKGRI